MTVALFSVEKTYIIKEGRCFILEGTSSDIITDGMEYLVPLNRSTAMSVHIDKVIPLEDNKIKLYSFFEDELDLYLMEVMNIGEETLEIVNKVAP